MLQFVLSDSSRGVAIITTKRIQFYLISSSKQYTISHNSLFSHPFEELMTYNYTLSLYQLLTFFRIFHNQIIFNDPKYYFKKNFEYFFYVIVHNLDFTWGPHPKYATEFRIIAYRQHNFPNRYILLFIILSRYEYLCDMQVDYHCQ